MLKNSEFGQNRNSTTWYTFHLPAKTTANAHAYTDITDKKIARKLFQIGTGDIRAPKYQAKR